MNTIMTLTGWLASSLALTTPTLLMKWSSGTNGFELANLGQGILLPILFGWVIGVFMLLSTPILLALGVIQ